MKKSQVSLSRGTRGSRHTVGAALSLWGPVALVLLAACDQAPAPASAPAPAAAVVEGPTQNGEPLKPVAVLELANGNTVSFYDGKTGGIITETGLADTGPTFDRDHQYKRSDQLIDAWKAYAAGQAVPPGLIDLQARLTHLPASADVAAQPKVEISPAANGGLPLPDSTLPAADDGLLQAPMGCNNGCCDQTWLATFHECSNDLQYPVAWFGLNLGSSFANVPSEIIFHGLICAAVGTSTYKLDVGTVHTTFPVAEAHFSQVDWTAGRNWLGWFSPQNMTSSVNTPTNMHLHTYCGYAVQD